MSVENSIKLTGNDTVDLPNYAEQSERLRGLLRAKGGKLDFDGVKQALGIVDSMMYKYPENWEMENFKHWARTGTQWRDPEERIDKYLKKEFTNTVDGEVEDLWCWSGMLDLSDEAVKMVPPIDFVGGSLFMFRSNDVTWPDGFSVSNSIDISESKVTSLPDNLYVGLGINASKSQLKKIGEGTVIGHKYNKENRINVVEVDFTDIPLETLPDDLDMRCHVLKLSRSNVKLIQAVARLRRKGKIICERTDYL